jgi:hypothetical protein
LAAPKSGATTTPLSGRDVFNASASSGTAGQAFDTGNVKAFQGVRVQIEPHDSLHS